MEETNEKILKRLDAYRAIEINNLWQRSVFLGTFLVLGYTGYGFLVDKMIPVTNNDELPLLHFLACALACINMIFSVLWIAMAKGSKAWYEVYENAIKDMELKVNKSYQNVRSSISLKFAQKSDCLFSTKAGGYSPAKINIVIGQISLILWCIVFLVHCVTLYCNHYELIDYCCLVIGAIVLFVTIVILICRLTKKDIIKSSYFKD